MFLDKIEKIKLNELELAKKPRVDVFSEFLKHDFNLIAEIKKASPSKGDINLEINPVEVAKTYIQNGARAISVLTEKEYFKGSIEYLINVRKNFKDAILLRKDFIIDPYQIYETKFLGADMILIILSLTKEKSIDLINLAKKLGLEVLLEVHSEDEIKQALKMNTNFIGINNRNLQTLETSLETSKKLAKYITNDKIFISESGIKSVDDIKLIKSLGYKGALIGTYFMRSDNIASSLEDFTK